MRSVHEFLDSIGINLGIFIPGFLGGISYAIVTKKNFLSSMFSSFVGAVTTSYLSPIVSPKIISLFSLNDTSVYGISFIIGLLSMNISMLLISNTKDIYALKRLFNYFFSNK